MKAQREYMAAVNKANREVLISRQRMEWAPAFLIMGVYNKMVKQHGSDVYSKAA